MSSGMLFSNVARLCELSDGQEADFFVRAVKLGRDQILNTGKQQHQDMDVPMENRCDKDHARAGNRRSGHGSSRSQPRDVACRALASGSVK